MIPVCFWSQYLSLSVSNSVLFSVKRVYLLVERVRCQLEMTWSQRLEFGAGGSGGLDLFSLSGICSYMENSEFPASGCVGWWGGFLIAETLIFCGKIVQ